MDGIDDGGGRGGEGGAAPDPAPAPPTSRGGSGAGPEREKKRKDKSKRKKRKAEAAAAAAAAAAAGGDGERGRTGKAPGRGRSPPRSFVDDGEVGRKTKKKKKRDGKHKSKDGDDYTGSGRRLPTASSRGGDGHPPSKKSKKSKSSASAQDQSGNSAGAGGSVGYSAAQAAVNDMMRRALNEDQYSALGSVVDTDSSDDEADGAALLAPTGAVASGGVSAAAAAVTSQPARLDRSVLLSACRKHLRMEGMRGSGGNVIEASVGSIPDDAVSSAIGGRSPSPVPPGAGAQESAKGGRKKKKKKGRRGGGRGGRDEAETAAVVSSGATDEDAEMIDAESAAEGSIAANPNIPDLGAVADGEYPAGEDEGSIFGQTTGASNATWVECDKCKKWRRLRGVVDAKKLPSKWYCHMNKNDPDRAKCSAPEEEYETPTTPESASDQRTRKHLRLWVRRLQCNEAYESRLPTQTRGKRRSAATSAKEPYEWVRCCNPSCGKWRALLRFMDAQTIIESCRNGEWYCVLNTWDEKAASCAAPQESLPAIGCPPWVMQDEE